MKAKLLFVLLTIVVIGICLSTGFTKNTPEAAIRRHLFWTNPAHSLSCELSKTAIVDKTYGQQYLIKGYIDPVTKGNVSFAYVKKNSQGVYYWTGGGSGP